MEHTITEGDTRPLRVKLLRANGRPIPLTGATVRFKMWPAGVTGTPQINNPAVVLEGTPDPDRPGRNFGVGVCEYQWGVGETVLGLYRVKFEVTSGGEIEHVPNDNSFTLRIE